MGLGLADSSEQAELQRLIECKPLVLPTPQPRLAIIERLVERDAEAVVLGCTDFPQLLLSGWSPAAGAYP